MATVVPAAPAYSLTLLLAVLLLAASSVIAQPPGDVIGSSGGLTYVVAFPDTAGNAIDPRYQSGLEDGAYVMIYSAVDARVSIRGMGLDTTVDVRGGSFGVVDLRLIDGGAPIVDEHCRALAESYRIESPVPIIIYQYLVTRFGAEAWTPQPVESWGREYYAVTHPGEVVVDIAPGTGEFGWKGKNRSAPAEILVVAAYNDTRITIVPNGQVLNFCRTENVTLKAGEVFQIQSFVDTLTVNEGMYQPDFGGTRIFSTKPVGVISGNTRSKLIDYSTQLGHNAYRNMLVEWLAPVDQHGTEFVYLPSWDSRRPTGEPGENPAEKRPAEIVRIYGTQTEPTGGYQIVGGTTVAFDAPIDQAKYTDFRNTPAQPRYYRTDRPAQVTMASAPAARMASETPSSVAYDVWGSSMVTLLPREQWVSFAPFHVPAYPASMEHFVNVVTDTAHRLDVTINGVRFPLDRPIAGTDLIWGSMSVQAGTSQLLRGANGARLTGNVYGSRVGLETFRSAGNAYEEYLGIAYHYPLVGRNRVPADGDSIELEVTRGCSWSQVRLEAVGENPVGLRSIHLEDDVNTEIVQVNPNVLNGAVKAYFTVGAIDTRLDAAATVVITDRSGKETRMSFRYHVEQLELSAQSVDFGVVSTGVPVRRSITVRNPRPYAVPIWRLTLLQSSPGYSIVSPTSEQIARRITLDQGDTLTIVVEALVLQPDQAYIDTLAIETGCTTWKIPLTAETSDPCVNVGDLDFGVLAPGQSRTLNMTISNDGGGVVTFSNPSSGPLIEWRQPGFAIAPADLEILRTAQLQRGASVRIAVTFTANDTGVYRDTARIWASVRTCRDLSNWVARVGTPSAAATGTDALTELLAPEPNPVNATALIRFTLARSAHATILLYDDRGARVATLFDEESSAGSHAVALDGSALPAGVYHYRLSAGEVSIVRSFVRK